MIGEERKKIMNALLQFNLLVLPQSLRSTFSIKGLRPTRLFLGILSFMFVSFLSLMMTCGLFCRLFKFRCIWPFTLLVVFVLQSSILQAVSSGLWSLSCVYAIQLL